MIETRIYGRIFLPDAPDEIVNGVWLNIKRGSIYLEAPYNALIDSNWKIILGEFNRLDKVTFINSYTGAGSSGSGGSWRKIHVTYLLKDCHIKSYTDLVFRKTHLSSPTLSNWIIEPDGISRTEENIYKTPEKKCIFSVQLSDFKISLNIFYTGEIGSNSLSIEKKCSLKVESSKSVHISEFFKIIPRIKKWILFITNKNSEFDGYFLVNDKGESFEMINKLADLNEDRFSQNISIRYHDIKESIDTVFKKWMEIDHLETIIDLIQEMHYNTDMTFQSYFLNMCVAMENFHSIYKDEIINENIEQKIRDRKTILELIEDPKLKGRFEQNTKAWDRATYRQRLKSFKPTFETIMDNTFELSFSSIVNKIVNTRNSLAHKGTYTEHLERIELLLIGKVMEFTLKYEILMLLEYGTCNDVLEDGKNHLKILADLNEYKRVLK